MSDQEEEVLLASADRALSAARLLFENGFIRDAVNRVYYAMFYAAQALLRRHGIEVHKHSAVESALGFHFAKTGKMEPRFHRLFLDARQVREIADYDVSAELVQVREDLSLQQGEEFLTEVKRIPCEADAPKAPEADKHS